MACSEPTAAALDEWVRPGMLGLRLPGAGDAVFNDECMVSFDSPFSPGGLFVNLRTFQGFGKDFLQADQARQAAAQEASPGGAAPTTRSSAVRRATIDLGLDDFKALDGANAMAEAAMEAMIASFMIVGML